MKVAPIAFPRGRWTGVARAFKADVAYFFEELGATHFGDAAAAQPELGAQTSLPSPKSSSTKRNSSRGARALAEPPVRPPAL